MSGTHYVPNGAQVDFWWHHPNSRKVSCRCGEVRAWALIPETDRGVKRQRFMCCGELHVRSKANRYPPVKREVQP